MSLRIHVNVIGKLLSFEVDNTEPTFKLNANGMASEIMGVIGSYS